MTIINKLQNIPSKFTVNSEKETVEFAKKLSKILQKKDIVLLSGELGAGKTFLARNVIQNLCGANTIVKSPSFPILQTYETAAGVEIFHYDLYRIKDADELNEVDFYYAVDNAITIVEWPDEFKSVFEKLKDQSNIISIKISYGESKEEARNFVVEVF